MPPTLGNGKICYLVIPAVDIVKSAAFYEAVCGWRLRKRGDGSVAFDDGVGQVSGTWVVGPPPSSQPGIMIYVMVDNVADTLRAVVAQGGEVVRPIGVDAPEITAHFRDPGGNVVGLYQERAQS
jgi:predicted enzyme related to lactoylglutathione lyase